MRVSQIYTKYQVMPNLQDHMLRVASVTAKICNNFKKPIDKDSVIAATSLHDIGNMVRFKLEVFPEFLKPRGLEYWRKIQENFICKYGKDDYQATYKILKEIGVNQKVYRLIKSIEFRKAPLNVRHSSFEKKICIYADLRVAPTRITSLNARLREVKDRYMRNKGISEKKFNHLSLSMQTIEKQIFAQTKIKPEDITEENVGGLIEKFKSLDI